MLSRLCIGVCGLALASTLTWAAEPPARTSSAARRAEVERLLDQPLDWPQGDRSTVTLEEFIAHVKNRHQLQIHWDASAFALLEGEGGGEALGELLEGVLGAVGRSSSPLAANASRPTNLVLVSQPEPRSPNATAAPAAGPIPIVLPNELPPPPIPETPGPYDPGKLGKPLPASDAPESAIEAVGEDVEPRLHDQFNRRPIPISCVALDNATVREGLEQLLHAAFPPMFTGFVTTNSMRLDYVIEGHAVSITTQLRANSLKETRVYRISQVPGVGPQDLKRVIIHSVRPWSWREQSGEIVERLAAHLPQGKAIPLPTVNFGPSTFQELGLDGVTLAAGATAPPQASPAPPATSSLTTAAPEITEEQLSMISRLFSGGAMAAYQSLVSLIEIVHHGDPPTGVIEALPGVLIITQSQSAHREIAALLEDLSAASGTD
ncbi:MAG: hypothetical protein KF774_18250 [Planctomyces sp.]|nr:hypothetical protein [Planctomyces sp.]